MHQVPGVGCDRHQPVGGGLGALGLELLVHVDQEVVGAGVPGVALEHRLEGGAGLEGAVARRAVVGPVVPGVEVHHRLGEERRGVEIVGMALVEPAHRLGVGGVEVRAARRAAGSGA